MINLLKLQRTNRESLIETVVEAMRTNTRKSLVSEKRSELANASPHLETTYSGLTVTAESTDEVKAIQNQLDIAEEAVRQLQEEKGLERLHHSRRAAFVQQLLEERVEQHVADRLAEREDQFRADAQSQVDELLAQEGNRLVTDWRRREDGSAISGAIRGWKSVDDVEHAGDEEPGEIRAEVSNAMTDFSDYAPRLGARAIVVPEGGATLVVDGDIGEQTVDLQPGKYSVRCRSIRDLVLEANLIEVERREASCSSSDREALDIVVGRGEHEDQPHVIELQSGDGGYSSRHTKGWTEYRDFDPERQMALITVGQASYYNNSMRGKQERTWLVGRDDGQGWAHQVYNTHETVEEALEFMKPAEVKRLEEKGRTVIRQGDVYFVEMERSSNFDDIEGTRHDIEEQDGTVVVSHPEHEDLELEGEWKALTNKDGSNPSGSTSSSSSRRRD